MGQRENSKFVVTNCKDKFKLKITTTCIQISEAVTHRCSVKKVLLKILQNFEKNTYARASFSFGQSSFYISKISAVDFEHVFVCWEM